MYGIYANIKGDIGGILMGSMLPYIAYMDPIGKSMDWFCWENLNRKPLFFTMKYSGFRLKCSHHPIL